MRFSVVTAIIAISSLALLSKSSNQVSAALTPAERAALELKEGPKPNYCAPCIQKAMHNHFPHACAADLDPNEGNERPTGSTDEEERCVCVAFNDLYWMKADCSAECDYTHSPKAMQYFLPASKIEGCDKWIDFSTGQEKIVPLMTPRNPDHKPEVFPIAPIPDVVANDENYDGRPKYDVHITHADDDKKVKEQLEVESGLPNEIKKEDSSPEMNKDDLNSESNSDPKDEL
ncbi:hypothetical protein BGZ99_006103 [Dissophora globulifera]|uniref:Uncharacterized protein n=1 Tax=Dissophora globulifera TaxID=979702 RepID=A0A9P6RFT8_9FUNG|nr:hypothetical protein BGZ99_006103 [Dissophora globulifera]